MSTFVEAEHPRDRVGQFAEKAHSDPEVSLAPPADDSWAPRYYRMLASRVPSALHRIEKANRRLERYGISERFEAHVEEYVEENPDSPNEGRLMAEVTLNTPVIAHGGWTFTGAHIATPDGHIVNHGPVEATDMRCDHCGHNRQRGAVYTVTNDAGETKQVGSNCMAAFLGVKPSGLWALTEDPLEEDADIDDETWAVGDGDRVFPARSLVLAALAVSNDGVDFVSRSNASMDSPPTSELVLQDATALFEAEHPAERQRLADDILAWVNEQPDDGSEYIRNLRAVLAGEERWVGKRHVALAVSAIAAYRNAMERREREARPPARGFVADVGERVRDIPVEVTKVRHIEGYYGTTTLLLMRTEDGRIVKWFASKYLDPDEGAKFNLTATVKEHERYADDDQTVVARAQLKELDE